MRIHRNMPFLKLWMDAGHMETSRLDLSRVKWSKTTAWAAASLSSSKSATFGLVTAFSMAGILGLVHLGFLRSYFALSLSASHLITSFVHPDFSAPFLSFLSVFLTFQTATASAYFVFASFRLVAEVASVTECDLPHLLVLFECDLDLSVVFGSLEYHLNSKLL